MVFYFHIFEKHYIRKILNKIKTYKENPKYYKNVKDNWNNNLEQINYQLKSELIIKSINQGLYF